MRGKLPLQQTKFMLSAAKTYQFPPDIGSEIAFVGRSNAGKSTAINTLTGIKKLAKTSKTPGCTQLINFFEITDQQRLVDLPGYGYAKVSETTKRQWHSLVEQYLNQRQSLTGLILVTDLRHALNPFDRQLLHWAQSLCKPIHILLTKADKLSSRQAKQRRSEVESMLVTHHWQFTTQLFSAHSNLGISEAQALIQNFLDTTNCQPI